MTPQPSTILLLDTEQAFVEALCAAFADRYTVYKAADAADAQDLLKRHRMDMILSDHPVSSPHHVVFSALDRAMQPPDTGLLLLTGRADLQQALAIVKSDSLERNLLTTWAKNDVLTIVLEVFNARMLQAHERCDQSDALLIQHAKMASLGELVAGIAHELNSPLGFVNANLGNLKKFYDKISALLERYDQADIPSAARADIEKWKQLNRYDYIRKRMSDMIDRSLVGAGRMNKIIQDIKAFSRSGSDQFAPANINAGLETTLGIMLHEGKDRITINKELGPIPRVVCDIEKLNQVFLNLLINACHAIDGNGIISVKTGLHNGNVKIEISDTGRGIDKAVMKNIFKPFYTTKPIGIGTGLGLSISHGIIEQHQGSISVKSDPGKGTTFTVIIPAIPKKEDRP